VFVVIEAEVVVGAVITGALVADGGGAARPHEGVAARASKTIAVA
jgi:hypothetical protein